MKTLRGALHKYSDYRVALADGFQPFLPNIPQPQYRFTNYWHGFLEAFTFDPARPTSLLYKKTPGGYELVGAMYTMPKNATEEQLNQWVPFCKSETFLVPSKSGYIIRGIAGVRAMVEETNRRKWGLVGSVLLGLAQGLSVVVVAVFTARLYYATHEYVKVASQQLQAMDKNTQQTKRMLELTEEQLKIANKSAEAATTSAAAAKESVNLSKKTLEISERAIVGMESIALTKPLAAGTSIEAQVTFKNTGRTPAYGLATPTLLTISGTPQMVFPKRPPSPMPINWADLMPESMISTFAQSGRTLSEDEVNLIKAGRAWIYVTGLIEYRDEFGKHQERNFCARYNPAKHPAFDSCLNVTFK